MSNKGQCWRLQLQREKKWTWLKPPGPSKAERQHSLLEAACVCYGAYSPVSLRLHTGHCPSYTVYSGLQPLCSKVHAYYYYTVSGLAVCLLLFFFIYLGKRLSQKRLGVRPKYGWTRFFSLVYGLAFHFPGTFSLQNGSSPRSSWLILLSTTTTNINIPKVCFFLMWWTRLLYAAFGQAPTVSRLCCSGGHTEKAAFYLYFAKIFDQLNRFSEVQSSCERKRNSRLITWYFVFGDTATTVDAFLITISSASQ